MSLAIYKIRDEIVGNFAQVLLLLLFIVAIIVILQLMMFVIMVLFLAFNLQMKHLVGRFSIVITMVTFFFSMDLWFKFTESKLYDNIFHHVEIPLTWLDHYFPKIQTTELLLGSFYVVEEVASIIWLAILFIIATKWLEKVVLR